MTAAVDPAALGAAIRRRREHRGMRPNILAGLAEIGPADLARIEDGTTPPDDRQLANIAVALASTPDALRRTAGWTTLDKAASR